MKFQAAAVLAATIAFAHPAAAQDVPQPYTEQDPEQLPDEIRPNDPLSGFRIEVAGGYDRLEINYVDGDTKYYDGTDGIRYGAEIGYDFAVSSNVLVGPYAAYAGSSAKRCDNIGTAASTVEICQQPKAELSGGVRAGIRFGGQSQFYGKVGYSSMPLEFSSGTVKESETYSGFQFGFGGEYGLGGGAFVKAELVATDFRTKGKSYEDYNYDRTHATVGIGFRF